MTHFTRTNNIALVSLALPLVYLFAESAFADERAPGQPNVVLIMTDDQGYGDLSCHGNRWLKTPNLDKLASQGIRLDDYHVSPYCVPTRAALFTGRYADRTGIHNVLEPHWFVRTNEVMLSNMFQDAGYATGMFGKWHLGDNYPYGTAAIRWSASGNQASNYAGDVSVRSYPGKYAIPISTSSRKSLITPIACSASPTHAHNTAPIRNALPSQQSDRTRRYLLPLRDRLRKLGDKPRHWPSHGHA